MYTDQEETQEAQERRIEFFKKKGNQQFTEYGRNAEITVDLVLQARAKLSDKKVNGPEDAIVSEMIKRLPMENMHNCEVLSRTSHGPDGITKLVELVFFKKSDAVPTKGIRSYRAIALTSVMSKWYASCALLRFEKEEEPRDVEELAHGSGERDKLPTPTGIDDEFIAKTLGMTGGKESRDETWYRRQADDVLGTLRHQDCLRRGETEARG